MSIYMSDRNKSIAGVVFVLFLVVGLIGYCAYAH